MKQVLVSFVFVFAFAAVGFGAVTDNEQERSEETVPAGERLRHYVAYQQCSNAALERHLSKDEVLLCSAIYLELKLSFVEDVTAVDYSRLVSAERARVSKEGYLAYRKWVKDRVIGLR